MLKYRWRQHLCLPATVLRLGQFHPPCVACLGRDITNCWFLLVSGGRDMYLEVTQAKSYNVNSHSGGFCLGGDIANCWFLLVSGGGNSHSGSFCLWRSELYPDCVCVRC